MMTDVGTEKIHIYLVLLLAGHENLENAMKNTFSSSCINVIFGW